MNDTNFHWKTEDYFPYLLQDNKTSILALEYLVDDLHNGREETINLLLDHCGSQDFLWSLVKLMSYADARISGNSAYIIGTIAENEIGISRIIELLNSKTNPESKNILPYLIKMLQSDDDECLMNAAGTIGTISENKSGRDWLLSQEGLDQVISLCIILLDNPNLWVSSNAALVLARVSIEEIGTRKLLNHHLRESILRKLMCSLGNDDAGRGMNCAFTIGRLCDSEDGRLAFLNLKTDSNKMISSLINMIEQSQDAGSTKNACFALSCLAGNKDAHEMLINHSLINTLLESLIRLVSSFSDTETQWFAAMHLRVIASLPIGCIKLKKFKNLEKTLRTISNDSNICSDVKTEVDLILDLLKPLEKPNPPKVLIEDSGVLLQWEPLVLKSKFQIQYAIYTDTACLYNGTDISFKANNLQPYTQHNFKLQITTVEDGEKSPFSETIQITTDEALPTEPLNFVCAGATTTLIKLTWDPPEFMNGIFKGYYIYNGKTLVDQTNDLMCVVTGLAPKTSYELHVCASTSKGKGRMASVKASTLELGDIIPERPTFGPVGRREILVKWTHPQVLAGKLNRYDLLMNGKCIYSGMALEFQVSLLKPDTEYKFEIVAITNEGKCKSKPSKARTLRDEFDRDDRAPLYPGPAQITQIPNLLFVNNDNPIQALTKKTTQGNENRINKVFLSKYRRRNVRRKSNFDNEETSAINRSSISDSSSALPFANQNESLNRINKKPSLELKRAPKINNFFREKKFTLARNNTEINDQTISIENIEELPFTKFNSKYPVADRSRTLFNFNKISVPKKTLIAPQIASLNIQEIHPEFPTLQTRLTQNHNVSSSTNIIPLNHRFMHQMKREKTINVDDGIPSLIRSNTYFNGVYK